VNTKEYLGDGVYIENEGYQLKLTTENGIATTNTIYMDESVLVAFEGYIRGLRGENGNGN